MKLSLAAGMLGMLWFTLSQAQVLPPSGPRSAVPHDPSDAPLVRPAADDPLAATGFTAGTPGPYLPSPDEAADRAH